MILPVQDRVRQPYYLNICLEAYRECSTGIISLFTLMLSIWVDYFATPFAICTPPRTHSLSLGRFNRTTWYRFDLPLPRSRSSTATGLHSTQE
jgi:hypothetical protein